MLDLRVVQLNSEVKMQSYESAYQTCQEIFKLLGFVKTNKAIYLLRYFEGLAEIFLRSGHYLFHAYAQFNVVKIYRNSKRVSQKDA